MQYLVIITIRIAIVVLLLKLSKILIKKLYSDEIIQILSEIPQEQDEVEHQINYKSWGTDKIPAQTALYWSVSLKDDNLSKIKIQVVYFISDTEWVFLG